MVKTLTALVAAASLVPFVANAQTTTTTTNTTTYENPEQFNGGPKASVGVFADTGVNSYTNNIAAVTQPGVAYGARIDLSPQRNIGFEIGYDGSLNDMKSSISGSGHIYGNAVNGDLRINLVPPNFDLPADLKPFIFAGVGWQGIAPQNFTPGINNANLLSVPIGTGLEADIGDHFLIGARFTYAFLFNESTAFSGRQSDIWGATADLGARFQ
jgi:hypothetical protein